MHRKLSLIFFEGLITPLSDFDQWPEIVHDTFIRYRSPLVRYIGRTYFRFGGELMHCKLEELENGKCCSWPP